MPAGPAAAATGNPASTSSAGTVLGSWPHWHCTPDWHCTPAGTAQLAGSPSAAVTALPFDQAAASARQSPLGTAAHAGASAPLGQSAHGRAAGHAGAGSSTQPPQHPGSVKRRDRADQQRRLGKPAHCARRKHRVAAPAPAPLRTAPAPAPAPQPFRIYDSVTPRDPAWHGVATYATGGYAVPASRWRAEPCVVDRHPGTDPAAQALDVEPGDATPAVAAAWASARLTHWPNGSPASTR